MKRITILLALVFSVILTSCGEKKDPNKEKFNQLLTETMELHDKVMAKMGRMNDLQQDLSKPTDSLTTVQYHKASQHLGAANSLMMEWMKDFNDEFPYAEDRLKGKTEAEIKDALDRLDYYKKEIEGVADRTEYAIKKAEEALKKK